MPHSRGEPISLKADIQNRLEEFALSQLTGGSNTFDSSQFSGAVVVKGFNASGALIDRDHIGQIGDMVIDPEIHKQARRMPCFNINAATVPASLSRIAIALEPVPENRFGSFAISGFCVASVFMVNATDRLATIDPTDSTRLRSGSSGEVRIVSLPTGGSANTERLCFIFFPVSTNTSELLYGFELTGAIEAVEQSASATIYKLDGTLFGATVGSATLYDPAQWYGPAIIGTRGLCQIQDGRYYAVQSSCGPTGYL